MALDIRVPVDTFFAPFAVPATVTRPDEDPIATAVIWVQPFTEDVPAGLDFQRAEPKRVLAIRRDEVPTVPLRTLVDAPEVFGGPIKRWRVDGFERAEVDLTRAVVIDIGEC